jgi:hypothetical protein
MVELHMSPSRLLDGVIEREVKRREERLARKKAKQLW